MKRIDFFGVPGAGKTTLYNELLKSHNRHDRWLTVEEAKIIITKRHVRGNFRSLKEFTRLLLLHTVNIRVVQKRLSEALHVSLANKALQKKLEEWMPFVELCGESLGDWSKPPFYRFLLARWFLSQLEDVALVESNYYGDYVLFAESLSQRATGLMPWDYSLVERQSLKYFNLMPAPYAVVVLRAEPQQVIKHIMKRSRQKIIAQHQGLSDHELLERAEIAAMIVEIGTKVLRERGIRILELDALLPLEGLVEETKKFIQTV